MNVADPSGARDVNVDVRRLLDAGYEVRFTMAPALTEDRAAPPQYMASITSDSGSRWRGLGTSPADALRGAWPLAPGLGCGHCLGLGCTVAACPTCAAYATATETAPACSVCGYAEYDQGAEDDEPYCSVCELPVGIFHGYGPGWHHWRNRADGGAELVAAGHVPDVAWRAAASQ